MTFQNWLDIYATVLTLPGVADLTHAGKNALDTYLRQELTTLGAGVTADTVVALVNAGLVKIGIS